MQGILLAAGNGSRLSPITRAVNKHLLPIFDKPMIYYPLTTLILAGATKVTVITNPDSVESMRNLLGDGREFGISINIVSQNSPLGLPHAILAAQNYLIQDEPFLVLLGDNFFHGTGLGRSLSKSFNSKSVRIFAVEVPNPEDYGVIEFDENRLPVKLHEKPQEFISKYAVPGFYYFPWEALSHIPHLSMSNRNEYEIVDLLNIFLSQGGVDIEVMDRGMVWFDGGTVESLMQVSEFVRNSQNRLGRLIGSPHEAALITNLISIKDLELYKPLHSNSNYWKSLISHHL